MQDLYAKAQVREPERAKIIVPPLAVHKEDPPVNPVTKVAPLEVIPSKTPSVLTTPKAVQEKLFGKPTFELSNVECECGTRMRKLRDWPDGTTTYKCTVDMKSIRF